MKQIALASKSPRRSDILKKAGFEFNIVKSDYNEELDNKFFSYEKIENLAKNIANKVKKTGKTVVLEPMNPYERRIIHSALQPNKYVETYSEGNEPYRHVVVTLKK